MIIAGVLCIMLALVCLQMVYASATAVLAVVFWAAIGSILIARGISKNKQRQQQSQQQTVIVNNYIQQTPQEKQSLSDQKTGVSFDE